VRDERDRRGGRLAAMTAALVLGAGGALAACAPRVGAAPLPSAVVATGADCRAPQVLAALGLADAGAAGAQATVTAAPAHADAPAAGAVPAGFRPVAALECTPGGPLRDAQGTWTSVTATRLEGDLAPLLTALRRTTTQAAADDEACAPHAGSMQLWLVDVLGQAIRVATPTAACGVPTPAVAAAVAALDTTDVMTYPVQLVAGS
jgi:hypothetical protein